MTSRLHRMRYVGGPVHYRTVPDPAALTREVAAWETHRNALGGTVHWQFTTADARIKLKQLYPIHES